MHLNVLQQRKATTEKHSDIQAMLEFCFYKTKNNIFNKIGQRSS